MCGAHVTLQGRMLCRHHPWLYVRGPSHGNVHVSLSASQDVAVRAVSFGRRRTDSLGVALVLGARLLQRDDLSAALDLSGIVALTFNTHLEWVLEQLLDRLHLSAVLSHASPAQQVRHAPLCQTRVVEAPAIIVPGLLIHTDLPEPRMRATSMGTTAAVSGPRN
jgi:hypothetical protein